MLINICSQPSPDPFVQQRSYIPTPAFTESLQMAARSRFFSVLTALPSQPWLSRALALMENLEADTKHFNLVNEIEADAAASRKSVKKMYAKLVGEDERNKVARSLVEGVVLLSYEEGEESLEALEVRFVESLDTALAHHGHVHSNSPTACLYSSRSSSRQPPRRLTTMRWDPMTARSPSPPLF